MSDPITEDDRCDKCGELPEFAERVDGTDRYECECELTVVEVEQ